MLRARPLCRRAACRAAADPFAAAPRRRTRRVAKDEGGGSGSGSRDGAARAADEASKAPPLPREGARVYRPPNAVRRAPDSAAVEASMYPTYHSLDDLFPGKGLGAAWAESHSLRRACRVALREDLQRQKGQRLAPAAEAAMRALTSSLMLHWDAPPEEYRALGEAFSAHGIAIRGDEFMATLGGLCGEEFHGTLIDISSMALSRPKAPHSWHQDSGLERRTALVGFPAEDNYCGAGVFSHIVKLGAPLAPNPGREQGEIVEWERYDFDDGDVGQPEVIPESCILRPLYKRGQEVVSYSDAFTLHSAPDWIYRESLWRFM